jgi:arsenical pump membrane protein
VAVAALVSFKTRSNLVRLLREISWTTLALVAGLFVMLDAAKTVGATKSTEAWLRGAETPISPPSWSAWRTIS